MRAQRRRTHSAPRAGPRARLTREDRLPAQRAYLRRRHSPPSANAPASFDNPAYVDIAIHNYRRRLGLAHGERRYAELEARLFEGPVITVPTITIASDFDGTGADGHAYAQSFSDRYSHRVLDGIGHNVPPEAPEAFADAIPDVGGAK